MYNRTGKLEPPNSFDFPFTPYEIQHDFMMNLYRIIEAKNIGIFESPTGTGKSLSLTCGALKWLVDADQLVKSELEDKITLKTQELNGVDGGNSSDWIASQYKQIQLKEELVQLRKNAQLIEDDNKRITDIQERKRKERKIHFSTKIQIRESELDEEEVGPSEHEDDFILDDSIDNIEDKENSPEKWQGNRIFFCSRTHSQLSQIVREIKNTIYGQKIRVVSLASRQNYCINPHVLKLKSNSQINERCLDLQKAKLSINRMDSEQKTKKKFKNNEKKCPYFAQNSISSLRDDCLTEIMDIEELVQRGRLRKACPYYASRMAAQDSQITLLPYQMLLHGRTRQQTGLNIADSIVIIDEAHNLLESISQIYSSEITLDQLKEAQRQLTAYKTKYFSRFSTKSLLKVNQLIFITNRLVKFLDCGPDGQVRMIHTHDLMVEGEFYTIKINEIVDFCEHCRLAQKVHGFNQKQSISPDACLNEIVTNNTKVDTKSYLKLLSEKQTIKNPKSRCEIKSDSTENGGQQKPINASSVIRPLLKFLECLMEKINDGRVLITYADSIKSTPASMKYCLLNPGVHFKDLLSNCRSIIVAGGTMQPTNDLIYQLFNEHRNRVEQYLFDHVVPKESVLPLVIRRGPSNVSFSFTFANRYNKAILSELAMTLRNICQVVPAGIVCFFISYEYMESFYNFLIESGHLNAIKNRKKVFKEPRTGSQVDIMLTDYARAAKQSSAVQQNGAILFSVIGGKLSEGLNFADDLGRCVIVVGLPYPNKQSPELAAKLKYLDEIYSGSAGNDYYENMCMKAVNQCIGRAIRHIKDYAVVLLLDDRYSQERILKKLPKWINKSLKCPSSFGMVQGSLAKFFKEKAAVHQS